MRRIILLLLALIGIFSWPHPVSGTEKGQFSGKLSLGYDNFMLTQAESRTNHSFPSVHLDSRLSLFPHSRRLGGVFRFQNGSRLISENENILLNQADLAFSLVISPQITSEVLGKVKYKSTSCDEDVYIQSQYGYKYWNSGVSLKFNGNDFDNNIRYLYHHRDYTDRQFLDSKNHQIQLMTHAFISNTLTGCLSAKVEIFRFSKHRGTLLQEHSDTFYELSFGCQWIHGLLINPSYALQRNTSDHAEYSFNAHQFSILTALPLCWKVTLQCYGQLQLCQYDSQEPTLSLVPDDDTIEQSNDVLVLLSLIHI